MLPYFHLFLSLRYFFTQSLDFPQLKPLHCKVMVSSVSIPKQMFITLCIFYICVFIISIYIVPILGIPYAFSAVASPLLGIMIDKTGRNVTFITLACFITLISHALFAFTLSKGFAYLAIGLMGLGYSLLAASLWPVIALVIPLHRQGTAFGKFMA